jgi:hypothetical protein
MSAWPRVIATPAHADPTGGSVVEVGTVTGAAAGGAVVVVVVAAVVVVDRGVVVVVVVVTLVVRRLRALLNFLGPAPAPEMPVKTTSADMSRAIQCERFIRRGPSSASRPPRGVSAAPRPDL